MVPVLKKCQFECLSFKTTGECDCATALTTFTEYTVLKKKCEVVKDFLKEFIEHVKIMHPCFLEVREPTYIIGFILHFDVRNCSFFIFERPYFTK